MSMDVKEMIVTTQYGSDKWWYLDENNDLKNVNTEGDIHCVKELKDDRITENQFQFYARESLTPETKAERKEQTVTNAEGNEENTYGIVYSIPVSKDGINANEMQDCSKHVHKVQIIMPLGGNNSGIFRQPRVGEKVLVFVSGTRYYLSGFIPETNDDFSALDERGSIGEKEGQVWRYKHTGNNYTEHPCSEIGFYTSSYERSYRKNSKPKGSKKFGETKKFDMNEISIISTGDIKNFASEQYSVLADSIKLGSGGGSGDPNTTISIDDDGNVNIKAKSSINLTVGRTSVKISEEGFNVNTKITESPVTNTYDASISLSPMGGFVASGMNCTLSAIKSSSIGDSMGGGISSSTGIVGLRGREIKIATYNKTEFKFFMLNNSIDYLFNIMSLSDGIHRRDFGSDEIHGERLEMFIKWANFARKVFTEAVDIYQSRDLINKAKEIQKKHDDEMKVLDEELKKKQTSYIDKKINIDANLRGDLGKLYDNEIAKGNLAKMEKETGLSNPTKEQFTEKYIDDLKKKVNAGLDAAYQEVVDTYNELNKKINSYYDELDEWDERWTGHNSKGASKYGNTSLKLDWSNFNPLKEDK